MSAVTRRSTMFGFWNRSMTRAMAGVSVCDDLNPSLGKELRRIQKKWVELDCK